MVDDKHPIVSIGMPIFNAEAHLAEAVESVLAQTYRDFELVICDNASTDGTEAICDGFAARDSRIRYYRNESNIGAAGNFNLAFDHARGEYFKWMAHDDLIAPTYLERCLAMYPPLSDQVSNRQPAASPSEAREDVVLVFPKRVYITYDGQPVAGEPDLLGPPGPPSFDRIDFRRLAGLCSSRCPIFVFGLMPRAVAATTQLMGNYPSADLVFVGEMNMRGVFREVPEELFTQRLHGRTPDALARMTKQGDAAWFDPKNEKQTRVRIERKLLVEFAGAVMGAPLSPPEKLTHLWHLRRHIAFRARRKLFLSIRRNRAQLWDRWTRLTVAAAQYSERSFIPLRAWVLLSALRGNASNLRLALSKSGPASEAALLDFAAVHLARHAHPASEAVLDDWIDRGKRSWWWAALKVRTSATPPPLTVPPVLSIRMIIAGDAPHLDDAIESVLRQHFANFELLIEVNDGSESAIRRIERYAARDARIRVIPPTFDQNDGMPRPYVAIEAARGRYYAEIKPCDVVHPDRFAMQIAFMEAHHEAVCVTCKALVIDENGTPIEQSVSESGVPIPPPVSSLHIREPLAPERPAMIANLPDQLHRARKSEGA